MRLQLVIPLPYCSVDYDWLPLACIQLRNIDLLWSAAAADVIVQLIQRSKQSLVYLRLIDYHADEYFAGEC